jgi:short-subunit dehydrogenase
MSCCNTAFLGDPAKMAKDGNDALMSGEQKVIPGMRNKLQAGMTSIMSESTVTGYICRPVIRRKKASQR